MSTPGRVISLPTYATSYGTPFLPAGFATGGQGRVFWVGNRSGLPSSNGAGPDNPISTIASALGKCQSGRGDIVYVLPGHAENISSATGWAELVAGTNVIGLGHGTARPTFTFSTATAKLTVTKANVTIRGCRFLAAGPAGTTALTVANAFAITAAGFSFVDNEVECGVDADQLCTDLFTLSAAADDCLLANNYIRGGAASAITTVVTTTGAVDRLRIIGNTVTAEVVTAATGVLFDLSNAAILDNIILNNVLANNTASSKYVIKPHATSTGFVDGNRYYTGDGATAPAVSAWTTFTTNYKFGSNYCVTAVGVSALLCPAADA
jgi:hypothetical protein